MPIPLFLIFAGVISYTDLRNHRIKNSHVALLGLSAVFFGANAKFSAALFFIFLIFFLMPTGLGFGDVKLIAAVGASFQYFNAHNLFAFLTWLILFASAHLAIESFAKGSLATKIALAPSIFLSSLVQLAAR